MAFFAEIVQLLGITKLVGQIYGVLYASPSPLGLTAIVGLFKISKGSAGQGLQLLRSLGAIYDVEQKEGTNLGVAYEVEISLNLLLTGVLHEPVTTLASAGANRLKRINLIAEQVPENIKFLDSTKQLENLLKRFLIVKQLLTALLGSGKKTR